MNEHLTLMEVQAIADGESQPADHVRQCVQCANRIIDAARFKREIRDVMREDSAPMRLAQTLVPALGRRGRPRFADWFAIAATIGAIVFAGLLVTRQTPPGALAGLADMHTTILAGANPVDVLSTDKHTVKPWFEGRVPFAVPVPDLSSTPFRLIGGRVVYWNGDPGAYLLIGKGAHRISVFVLRNLPEAGAAPPAVSTLAWKSNGLEVIAVGDVPPDDLAQLRAAFTR